MSEMQNLGLGVGFKEPLQHKMSQLVNFRKGSTELGALYDHPSVMWGLTEVMPNCPTRKLPTAHIRCFCSASSGGLPKEQLQPAQQHRQHS